MGINAHIRENSKLIKTDKRSLKVVQYENLILNEKLLKRIKKELKDFELNWSIENDVLVINYGIGTIRLGSLKRFITEEYNIPRGDLNSIL